MNKNKVYRISGQILSEAEYIRVLQGHIYRYESNIFMDPQNKTWCSKEDILEAMEHLQPPLTYITAYVFIDGRWEYISSNISRSRGYWP